MSEAPYRFALGTLTCNNRETIFPIVESLLKYTRLPHNTQWFILLQGCSDEHLKKLQTHISNLLTSLVLVPSSLSTSLPIDDDHKEIKKDTDEHKDCKKVKCKIIRERKIDCLGHIKMWCSNDITINLLSCVTNLGLSKGNNVLNAALLPFKYVLFVEDDWYCLPSSLRKTILKNDDDIGSNNGIKDQNSARQWLNSCLEFMDENTSVSTLFLRRYSNAREKSQYGWNSCIHYTCHKHAADNFNYSAKMKATTSRATVKSQGGIKFQQIPTFLFTFNPHLRRNIDYYEARAFPLPEFNDVSTKTGAWLTTQEGDVPNWGHTEALTMEKTRHLETWNVDCGIFGHFEDFQSQLFSVGEITKEQMI